MTPITNAAKTTPSTTNHDDVKRMLRDAAFVLQMTRRVKAEILSERAESTKTECRSDVEVGTGLGV